MFTHKSRKEKIILGISFSFLLASGLILGANAITITPSTLNHQMIMEKITMSPNGSLAPQDIMVDLNFDSLGTSYMRKLGIGTRSPQSALQVSGDIRANRICTQAGACIDIANIGNGGGGGTLTEIDPTVQAHAKASIASCNNTQKLLWNETSNTRYCTGDIAGANGTTFEDTNAATICANGEFLNGDGSCDSGLLVSNAEKTTWNGKAPTPNISCNTNKKLHRNGSRSCVDDLQGSVATISLQQDMGLQQANGGLGLISCNSNQVLKYNDNERACATEQPQPIELEQGMGITQYDGQLGIIDCENNEILKHNGDARICTGIDTTHPTGDGNRHVPVTNGGDINKFLKAAGSVGAAPAWTVINTTDVQGLETILTEKMNTSHAANGITSEHITSLNGASSMDTISTIVKRDSGGGFVTKAIKITQNLVFPDTFANNNNILINFGNDYTLYGDNTEDAYGFQSSSGRLRLSTKVGGDIIFGPRGGNGMKHLRIRADETKIEGKLEVTSNNSLLAGGNEFNFAGNLSQANTILINHTGSPYNIDGYSFKNGLGNGGLADITAKNMAIDGITFNNSFASAEDVLINFGMNYQLYGDNTYDAYGNTSSSGRLRLNTPNGGDIIFGPRGGESKTKHLRIRADETKIEGKLEVTSTATASAFLYSSDRRLKENLEPLDSALTHIRDIQAYTFDWKKDGTPSMGFVAQDLQKHYPLLVHTGANGYLTVDYSSMTVPLLQAVKELDTENQKLKSELASITQRLEALEAISK